MAAMKAAKKLKTKFGGNGSGAGVGGGLAAKFKKKSPVVPAGAVEQANPAAQQEGGDSMLPPKPVAAQAFKLEKKSSQLHQINEAVPDEEAQDMATIQNGEEIQPPSSHTYTFQNRTGAHIDSPRFDNEIPSS